MGSFQNASQACHSRVAWFLTSARVVFVVGSESVVIGWLWLAEEEVPVLWVTVETACASDSNEVALAWVTQLGSLNLQNPFIWGGVDVGIRSLLTEAQRNHLPRSHARVHCLLDVKQKLEMTLSGRYANLFPS